MTDEKTCKDCTTCTDGVYIVSIEDGESRVWKMPDEENNLLNLLILFKSWVGKNSER